MREREVLDYFCEGGGVGGTASRLEHILVNIDSIIDKIETSIKVRFTYDTWDLSAAVWDLFERKNLCSNYLPQKMNINIF